MHRHITVLSIHNQLSARVDSQINFSVVVHGRMQDLQRGGQLLLGGGGMLGWSGACFPPQKNFNGAIWCVLEHIFIIFYFQKVYNFAFNFLYQYSFFIQEIMIIKAMRLQAWAPAGRGGGGKSKPSPPSKKRSTLAILGAFLLLFFSYGALFATFFSFLGAFLPCGSLFATFYFMVGAFLGACPPPLTKISAGSHDCKEGSRACSPEFFCVTTI